LLHSGLGGIAAQPDDPGVAAYLARKGRNP
jgi:hypothetical protein